MTLIGDDGLPEMWGDEIRRGGFAEVRGRDQAAARVRELRGAVDNV